MRETGNREDIWIGAVALQASRILLEYNRGESCGVGGAATLAFVFSKPERAETIYLNAFMTSQGWAI